MHEENKKKENRWIIGKINSNIWIQVKLKNGFVRLLADGFDWVHNATKKKKVDSLEV